MMNPYEDLDEPDEDHQEHNNILKYSQERNNILMFRMFTQIFK